MHRTTKLSQHAEFRTFCSHLLPATDTALAHSCGSPALPGQAFRFYRHPARPRIPTRHELQRSFGHLINLIDAGLVDNRPAHQLLAALNAASRSLLP